MAGKRSRASYEDLGVDSGQRPRQRQRRAVRQVPQGLSNNSIVSGAVAALDSNANHAIGATAREQVVARAPQPAQTSQLEEVRRQQLEQQQAQLQARLAQLSPPRRQTATERRLYEQPKFLDQLPQPQAGAQEQQEQQQQQAQNQHKSQHESRQQPPVEQQEDQAQPPPTAESTPGWRNKSASPVATPSRPSARLATNSTAPATPVDGGRRIESETPTERARRELAAEQQQRLEARLAQLQHAQARSPGARERSSNGQVGHGRSLRRSSLESQPMECDDDAVDQPALANDPSPGPPQILSPAEPPSTSQLTPNTSPTVPTTETPSQRVRRMAAKEQEERQTARIEALRRSPLPPKTQENKGSYRAQMRRSTRLANTPRSQLGFETSAAAPVPAPANAPAHTPALALAPVLMPAPVSVSRPGQSAAPSNELMQACQATESLQSSSSSASTKPETPVEQALRKARESQERRRKSQSNASQPASTTFPAFAANQPAAQHNRTQVKIEEEHDQEYRPHGSDSKAASRNTSTHRPREGQVRAEQPVAVWNSKVKRELDGEPPLAQVKTESCSDRPVRSTRSSSSHANVGVPAQKQRDVQRHGPLPQGQGTAVSLSSARAEAVQRRASRNPRSAIANPLHEQVRSAIANPLHEQVLDESRAATQSGNHGHPPPLPPSPAQEQSPAEQPPRESIIERAQRMARERSGRRNAK